MKNTFVFSFVISVLTLIVGVFVWCLSFIYMNDPNLFFIKNIIGALLILIGTGCLYIFCHIFVNKELNKQEKQ